MILTENNKLQTRETLTISLRLHRCVFVYLSAVVMVIFSIMEPMIVFGITGGVLGMVVGGRIDPPLHPEGQMGEIFPKQIVIGGLIGTFIGSTIGYHLGREKCPVEKSDTTKVINTERKMKLPDPKLFQNYLIHNEKTDSVHINAARDDTLHLGSQERAKCYTK